MTEKQFLDELKKVAGQYRWQIVDGEIVGVINGRAQVKVHSPITAIANAKIRKTRHGRLLRHNETGYNMPYLKINAKTMNNIERATVSASNRGYTQVLRGKIRKAVGLK